MASRNDKSAHNSTTKMSFSTNIIRLDQSKITYNHDGVVRISPCPPLCSGFFQVLESFISLPVARGNRTPGSRG